MKTALIVEADGAFVGREEASVVPGRLKPCSAPEMRDEGEKLAANVSWLSDDAGLEMIVCCPSELGAMLRVYNFQCGQDIEIASGLATIEFFYAQATSSDDDKTKVRQSQSLSGQEMVYDVCDALKYIAFQTSGAGNMHEHDVCWMAYQNDEIASGYDLLHASALGGDRDVQKCCVDVGA